MIFPPNFNSHSIDVINVLPKIKYVQYLPYMIFKIDHRGNVT